MAYEKSLHQQSGRLLGYVGEMSLPRPRPGPVKWTAEDLQDLLDVAHAHSQDAVHFALRAVDGLTGIERIQNGRLTERHVVMAVAEKYKELVKYTHAALDALNVLAEK